MSLCSVTSPTLSDWNTRISGGVRLRNITLAGLTHLHNVHSKFEREDKKQRKSLEPNGSYTSLFRQNASVAQMLLVSMLVAVFDLPLQLGQLFRMDGQGGVHLGQVGV